MFGWFWVFFFLETNTSWAGLLVSGLISIYQLKAHLEIKNRSLLTTSALSCLSLTIVNREESSAKSFALDFNSFGKSLIWTRKRSGPRMEPWGTPIKTGLHDEVFLFKTTLWSLPDK